MRMSPYVASIHIQLGPTCPTSKRGRDVKTQNGSPLVDVSAEQEGKRGGHKLRGQEEYNKSYLAQHRRI